MLGLRFDRYKVLGAAYALSRFTVSDLVEYTQVASGTVRTILNRDSKFFRAMGKVPQKRGRPQNQYELCKESVIELDGLLGTIHNELREIRPTDVSTEPHKTEAESDKSELDLLATEQILLDEIPSVKDVSHRRKLLRIAEDYRENHRDDEQAPHLIPRWQIIDSLLELSRLELLWEMGTNLFFFGRFLFRVLSTIRDLLPSLESDLQKEIRQRLRNSALLTQLNGYLSDSDVPSEKTSDVEENLFEKPSYLPQVAISKSHSPWSGAVSANQTASQTMLRASDFSSACRVNLVQADATDRESQNLVDHVCVQFGPESSKFSLHEFENCQFDKELRKAPLSLLAVNSANLGSKRVLEIASEMSAHTQDVCVLDVSAKLDLRDELCSLGANYVGAALRLNRQGMLTAVPYLEYLCASFGLEEVMKPSELRDALAY